MNELKKAYLAGGCFWGMEELFRSEPGILSTEVGYCGGTVENPNYNIVKQGQSGHAESLAISYDPSKTNFKQILKFFFSIHDPTTSNRQGNDVGSQYRSVIFYQSDEELTDAKAVIEELDKKALWPNPIATNLEPMGIFYSAEKEHQNYLLNNPGGYTCHWQRYPVNN